MKTVFSRFTFLKEKIVMMLVFTVLSLLSFPKTGYGGSLGVTINNMTTRNMPVCVNGAYHIYAPGFYPNDFFVRQGTTTSISFMPSKCSTVDNCCMTSHDDIKAYASYSVTATTASLARPSILIVTGATPQCDQYNNCANWAYIGGTSETEVGFGMYRSKPK